MKGVTATLGVPLAKKEIEKGTGIAGNVVTKFTVPVGERWLLLQTKIALTTDGTVVTRYSRTRVVDIADETKMTIAASGQDASLGPTTYNWMQGASDTYANVNALGVQILDAGEDVDLYIVSGQAGDSYNYLVEYLVIDV